MEEYKSEMQELTINYMTFKTLYTRKFHKRRIWEAPDPCKIFSYIPGTVTSLPFKVGEEVKEGETIFVFESMKMQNSIQMPYDGIIRSINVAMGEKFPKEVVLLEIE